jgi:anaerobic magnesium-protoporphyrin IX monomethyl ester cyclase
VSTRKAMKILLINPNPRGQPAIATYLSPAPLGLLYIAAALRQAGYDRVNILDARVHDLGYDEVLARIEAFSPDIVGISSMSLEAREAHALAGLAKKADTRCKVVVGGAYAATSPEIIIRDPNIDFVAVGEGERTICELADALADRRALSGINGLVFRSGGVPVFNPRREMTEDIDSIPFPAWDLLDMDAYFSPAHRHAVGKVLDSRRVLQIFTSRGCPFGCIYCHNIFGKRIRMRSVENVIREIELLVDRYAPEEMEIVDDIFNYDRERAKRICDEIIKRGIRIKLSFPVGLRVDNMDEELVRKLKEAGTRMIDYAIESGSPEMQKRIGKNLDLVKAGEIARLTAGLGIITGGFFMLGFPGETKEEMLKTIRFAQETPFHFARFFYVTPRPNTPLAALLKDVDLNATPLHHYLKFSVNLSSVGDAALKGMWLRAHAGFYLRPAQMWRIWKVLPDKGYILRAFFTLLKHCVIR